MTSCWRKAWWRRARTAASSCARAAASLCRRRPSPGDAGQPVSAWATATGLAAPRADAPIDATALIRGMFHKVSNKPQPGMGVFPPEWMESTFMPAAVRKVTSTRALQEFSLQYGEPMGDSGLAPHAVQEAGDA